MKPSECLYCGSARQDFDNKKAPVLRGAFDFTFEICNPVRELKIYLRTASLRDFPDLKAGSFIAGILIFWLGLRGFTPVRAARLETRNVPKPVTVTFSPFLRDLVMLSKTASKTSEAAFFVTPVIFAAWSTRSCFVMFLKIK